jgi:molybdopterin converting factor small subunit
MREALESSPHLADTLMLNGDRCAVADNRDRVLVDGDQIYLLAPLAGG